MTKKNLLIIPLLFFSVVLLAQSKSNIEDMHIGKYAVKLIANSDNTYGYEITDGEIVIIHQQNKPYSSNKAGFTQKQNAMVIAIWLANELNEGRKNPKVLDAKKAKELGITKEDL